MTEAIVLVGGQGTRLRPLTARTAKPLLPVGGVPFLAHQLARLRDAGIVHVVLATSYRAQTFTEAFGDGTGMGLELEYVHEEVPLGTGGALRNAAPALRGAPDEPVVVLNGDILSGHALAGQVARHVEAGADATLHLVRVPDARAFGCVPTDDQGRVTAFLEKMPEPVTDQVNAGCYVFRRSVLDEVPAARPVSVERETFPGLLAAGRLVLGVVDQAYWLDLGTPAAYVQGCVDVVRGVVRSSALAGEPGERLLLEGASVSPEAKVVGGSTVGRDARVDAGAEVDGSVLLDGAVVQPGAVVRGSVVGAGAVVGRDCVLESAVVGDGAQLGPRNELLAGVRVGCDAVLGEAAVRFSSDAG